MQACIPSLPTDTTGGVEPCREWIFAWEANIAQIIEVAEISGAYKGTIIPLPVQSQLRKAVRQCFSAPMREALLKWIPIGDTAVVTVLALPSRSYDAVRAEPFEASLVDAYPPQYLRVILAEHWR